MANIGFVMLPEEGHLLPSFKLAKSLKTRGHRVCYLVNHDYADEVRAQGLECISTGKDFWRSAAPRKATGLEGSELEGIGLANKIIFDRRDEMADLLKSLRSNLLIVDSFLPIVALLAHENSIPIFFINVCFDIGIADTLLEALMQVDGLGLRPSPFLSRLPELVLCPREFEFSNIFTSGRPLYYSEALIDLERPEPPFPWESINEEKPLIYCSMGSQAHAYKESRQFFQTIINAMREREQWQMILSVGKHLSAEFENVPENVLVVNWVPQLEVLKRASLMITHGGLGTVKECIYFGVPMIVFPMVRNQPQSGARVVYHGLGVRGDMRNVTVEQVHALIEKVEQDDSYRERVKQMSVKFREMEESGKGVRIIEKMLDVLEKKRSSCKALAQ